MTVTINKAAPTVTAPTAKTLTYNGSAQELVTAGTATGGTMYYAVTTENTAPTDDNLYTTSIPTATNAGTYYIWYKVKGDDNHEDSDPQKIDSAVTIDPKQVKVTGGITASNKTYDGTTSATVTVALNGVVSGDDVTGKASGTFTDASVGDGKTVTVTGFLLEGTAASNYALADTTETTTANITKRAITITASDQTVNVGGSISKGTNKVSVTSGTMAAGQAISEVTLSSSSTASTTTSETITPSEAVIKAGDEDVTPNYEITYIDGKLTVTRASSSSSSSSSSRSSGSSSSSSSGSSGSGSSGSSGSSSGGSSYSGGVDYNELSAKLTSAISVINTQKANNGASGVTQQTVVWDKGNSIPYSAMKTLQDNPDITLVFRTTYGGMNYTFTIPGKVARAIPLIPWYGPLYLLANYGQYAVATPVSGGTTVPVVSNLQAAPTGTYTVVKGDTLIKIASKYNTTVKKLVEANGIKNQNLIFPGQILRY